MDIITQVFEAIESDDCNREKQSDKIIAYFSHLQQDYKNQIDNIFISLCGWSLSTLIERRESHD